MFDGDKETEIDATTPPFRRAWCGVAGVYDATDGPLVQL